MSEANPQDRNPSEGQEAQHQKSLASVLDCVIVMDASGRVVAANDRAANLAQLDPSELKQVELPQIAGLFKNHVQDSEAFQKQLAAVRQMTPPTAELVFPLAGAVGSLRVYLMPVVRVQSPPELEPTKRAERSKEEEAEHLKKEFLSTISHELRTPLTAIKGSLGLALGGAAGPLAPELRELLELAEKNTDRLISLTTSILDMFKLETRRLPLRVEPISVAESIEHELSSHRAGAEKKNVTLEAQLEPDLPPANADRTRLAQTLGQLFSNAIKCSPRGATVTVAARRVMQNGTPFVEVSVHDQGKGIPRQAQKRIFSKFSQAEDTLTREHQGSGLGLAIARAIIERHGGHIWFDSEVGRGSTFFFTLPACTEPASEAALGTAGPFDPEQQALPLVLVVDDNQDVAQVVCGIFKRHGYQAWAVDRSEEAVEMAERHRPALITLDLLMPGVSGLEVLHLLKQNDHTCSIPVICTSMVDDPGQAMAMGAEKFASKPIDAHALVDIARSILDRQTGT